MVDEMKFLYSKLQSDMDMYVLHQSLKIQSDIADLKQEMRKELLEELTNEKIRIKNELITKLRTT